VSATPEVCAQKPSPTDLPKQAPPRLPVFKVLREQSAVVIGDNMSVLSKLSDESVQLVYIDPPFNTGTTQSRKNTTAKRSDAGSHVGFGGNTYELASGTERSYSDTFSDFEGFLLPRLEELYRVLAPTGTIYVHLDWREVHYIKVAMDKIFGRENFLNEIIWAYDYGAKSQRHWPTKHDTILVYVKDRAKYYYSNADVDREPYMAPGLVTPEKQARGKLPTDTWWHTIVSPTGREKTGYPTQKPLGILRRIINASSAPGDWVLDCFAGSGTTGAAAAELGRRFIMVDSNPTALAVMKDRLPPSTKFYTTGRPRAS
jgi:site-specific DNA-methyltransferase (adenine-specific)